MTSVTEKKLSSVPTEEAIVSTIAEEPSKDMKEKVVSENAGESEKNEENEEAAKKKEPVLTPAPLPIKSPWKSVSSDIPVANIPLESLEAYKKKKNRTTAPVSSNTKWVPMKASIVVSGSKKSGAGGKKSASKASSNNKSNNGGSKKKKQQQGQTQQFKKQQPKSNNVPTKANNNGDKVTKEEIGTDSQQKTDVPIESAEITENEPHSESQTQSIDLQQEHPSKNAEFIKSSTHQANLDSHSHNGPQTHSHQQNRRSNEHNQYQHYPYQQNGYQRGRNYSNYNGNEPFQPSNFVPFQQQRNNFGSYQGRVPRTFNPGYRPRYQQQSQAGHAFNSYNNFQPMVVAINNIAKQIDYYFSAENLNKDEYLRTKLSKEGYAPLALIAKFYRVVNMSFGGDSNLILAALTELVMNENSNVEVATGSIVKGNESPKAYAEESSIDKFFIRAKNWSSLLPEEFSTVVEIEKTLTSESMKELSINLPNFASDASGHDNSSNLDISDEQDLQKTRTDAPIDSSDA